MVAHRPIRELCLSQTLGTLIQSHLQPCEGNMISMTRPQNEIVLQEKEREKGTKELKSNFCHTSRHIFLNAKNLSNDLHSLQPRPARFQVVLSLSSTLQRSLFNVQRKWKSSLRGALHISMTAVRNSSITASNRRSILKTRKTLY